MRAGVIQSELDRRHFLRAGAAALVLPALESFAARDNRTEDRPRNFVAVGTYLGWHQNAFFPKQVGKNHELPPTLTPLADYRDDFTVFSGLDHRSINGHGAWSNFLCGQSPKSFSLDQMIADSIGAKSRFPSIQLVCMTISEIGQKVLQRKPKPPLTMCFSVTIFICKTHTFHYYYF